MTVLHFQFKAEVFVGIFDPILRIRYMAASRIRLLSASRLACLVQTRLVQAMVLAGEVSVAMDFATILQLPASAIHVDPSVLAEQAAHCARTYLQLPIPSTSKVQLNITYCSEYGNVHVLLYLTAGTERCKHETPVQVCILWIPRSRFCLLLPRWQTVLCWVWTVNGNRDLKQASDRDWTARQ